MEDSSLKIEALLKMYQAKNAKELSKKLNTRIAQIAKTINKSRKEIKKLKSILKILNG